MQRRKEHGIHMGDGHEFWVSNLGWAQEGGSFGLLWASFMSRKWLAIGWDNWDALACSTSLLLHPAC